MLTGVHVIESAKLSNNGELNNPSDTHPQGYPFQVGYQENDQKYILYLLAEKDQDRVDWIQSIRTGNQQLGASLHFGIRKFLHKN